MQVIRLIKKNMVCTIALVLAILSMFIYPPSYEYFNYINFDVLILLFCMMIVVEGFSQSGLFKKIACVLLSKIRDTRKLALCFIFICFFLSMLITNDVVLITFVPFTIMVMDMIGLQKNILYLIVLETVAANLGSMMTPIGNPQNLYLYSISELDIIDFCAIILPYTAISGILLIISSMFIKKEQIMELSDFSDGVTKNINFYIYIVLFILCIFSVLKIFNYYLLFATVVLLGILFFRKLFFKIDYVLLLTFIGFFVFVGNIGRVDIIKDIVNSLLDGNEVFVSIGLSQIISNVPATLFLSGFSDNYSALLIGVNLGGLGTLIASMASLISYKFYSQTENSNNKCYLAIFTLINLIFLFVLCLFYFFNNYFFI